MFARLGRIAMRQGLTCESIVKIVEKELRSRNFARTGERSDPIDVKCLATGASFDRTVAIFVATGAIFGTIAVTHDTRSRARRERVKGERVSGKRSPFTLFPVPPLPLFYL